jgi:hypothetical protein
MAILGTRIRIARILAWFNSINKRTSVSLTRTLAIRLNSMNRDIGSRDVYLLIVAGDDVTGDGDADGDAASGDGARSSMSSGGRSRSSWRWIRRDVAPPDLDGRRPVIKTGSSRAKSASQKPYSSSSGVGLQGRGFRRPALRIAGAVDGQNGETTTATQWREEKNTNRLP